MPDAPPAPLLGSTGTTTFVLVTLLVALGVAMIVTTVWLVRATRTDVPALGPLEVMGDRRWHRADAERRSRSLDGARPSGALPPAPILDAETEPISDEPPPASPPLPEPTHAAPREGVAANGEPGEREPASTAHSSEEDPQPAETA